MKIKYKVCKHHSKTQFVLEKRGSYRCKKCRSIAVSNNRRKRKLKLIKLHNSKCKICGYKKCVRGLQFHHLDPKEKSFGIAEKGACLSFKKMIQEISKCILVCANCHAEIEHGLIKLGTMAEWSKAEVY